MKSGRTLSDFSRLWGCSTSSMGKWLKRYREEGPKGLEGPEEAQFSGMLTGYWSCKMKTQSWSGLWGGLGTS